MAHWLLACKELNGIVYVSRLPKAINKNTPGIPSPWEPVGPGFRPSVQIYTGNGSPADQTQFILTFEYLSHLVTRVLDISVWPPAVVDPVTFNPTSIELPIDAVAVKLASAEASSQTSYYFNPVFLNNGPLFVTPGSPNNTWLVVITPASFWTPLFLGTQTAYYRVYRRAIGTSTWTLLPSQPPQAYNWNTTLNYSDTTTSPDFRFEYTVTWGMGPNPSNPEVNTDFNEGVIGGGTILHYDSTDPAQVFDYALSHTDSINIGIGGLGVSVTNQSTNAYMFGDPKVEFNVLVGSDEIDLPKSIAVLDFFGKNANAATPDGSLSGFPGFATASGSDEILLTAASFITNANAAPAGMF